MIDNSGTIALDSTGSETNLEILMASVRLQGGGQMTLVNEGTMDGTGSGYALISGHGLIEFGASSSEDVTFAAVGDGTLKLDVSTNYTGTVSSLSDGVQTASVKLQGQYTTAEFQMSANLLGGTMLTLVKPLEPVV